MFLKTADYVLSDDIAVEKKSVNTKDLQNSLRTQRLDEQMKRMNATFRHAYLLIEFEEERDVKKENFGRIEFGKGNK
jgi:ERCC4-type nuclease